MSVQEVVTEAIGRSFVFMIRENYEILIREGVIGYKIPIEKPNFLFQNNFFVAVSQTGIFGPFRQTSDLYEDRKDLGFKRLSYESGYHACLENALCPHRFNCQPINNGDLRWGITFAGLEQAIGNDPRIYYGIWELELELHQFLLVEDKIKEIQSRHNNL